MSVPIKQITGLSFGTPALLAAFDATSVSGFVKIGCGVINDEYQLILAPSAALLAAADGVNVIAAAAPAGAVWARSFVRNLPAQYETTWFLDAVTGSDANAGTTIGSPLKTMKELSARLRGATISADVTITLAAGNYGADPVEFDLTIGQGVSVLMVGHVATTSDVFAAVTNTTPGAAATNAGAVRGLVQATAATFADRQRLTVTDGAAAGCMAWVTKVTIAGAGGSANVSRFGKLNNVRTSTLVTLANPSAGDHYTLDTLDSQVGYINVRVRGPGRFVIQSCLVRSAATSTVAHRGVCDNGNGNGVQPYGCQIQGAASTIFHDGEWTVSVCQISADNGNIVYNNNVMGHRLCVWTGTAGTPNFQVFIQGGATLQVNESGVCDGGNFLVQTGAYFDQPGETNNDMQFVDGTSAHAIEVAPGASWWSHSANDLVWGLDNAYSSVTLLVDAGGGLFYSAKPSIPGGTGNDFNVGGTLGNWAALPVVKTATPGALAVATS
jgi:hypothetical protein